MFELFKKANKSFESKNIDDAINLYKEAIDGANPKRFFYFQNMALAQAEKQNFAEAEYYARLAVAYAPHLPELKSLFDYYVKNNPKNKQVSNPALSIIVPVYNSGKYLKQCLDSILEQNFKNFELIIINDGSNDDSGSIIKDYAARDNRIVLIENKVTSGSPGTPRNQALKIAKGDYVGFVDSDDWIGPDFYACLMQKAKDESADIVFSGGYKKHIGEKVSIAKFDAKLIETQKHEYGLFHGTFMIWDKIYKRDLLNRFDILLGDTPAAVDVPFIFKAYFYAQKLAFFPQLLGYHYRIESDSSITTNRRKKMACNFEFTAYKTVEEWAAKEQLPDYFTKMIDLKKIGSYTYTMRLINAEHFPAFFKKAKAELKTIKRSLVEDFCQVIGNQEWLQRFDDVCQLSAEGYFKKHRQTVAASQKGKQ